MKLFVSETKVQDAVIPIRWCLTREELKELEKREAKNPHLLLVVTHENQEVDRYLVPISQMLAYIQFHKPGENRILATVVWQYGDDVYKFRKEFLQQSSRGYYEQHVLNYGGKNLLRGFNYPRLDQQTEITVMVPAELFAKEPPAWEKWWVNLLFNSKPQDQCQFRRRRMIAYSIQPLFVLFIVPILAIVRFLAASVLLFLGKREVNLEPIIHPFKHETNDVWRNAEDSVFLRDAEGKRQHWLITLFSPPVFLGFLAILAGIRFVFPSFFSQITLLWWYYPLVALAVLAGIAVTGILLLGLFSVIYSLLQIALKVLKAKTADPLAELRKTRIQAREKREQEEAERKRRKEEQLRVELEQLLMCDGGFIPKLSELPKEKQTIYLRFQDLKAKVCKPYAR